MAVFSKNNEEYPEEREREIETVIGPSVKVEGEFVGKGDVVVQGTMKGTLKTTKTVTIGEHATIKANVEAASVHCAGTVHGNIRATELTELKGTARVKGNITTKQMSIENGATFNGKCAMGDDVSDEKFEEHTGKSIHGGSAPGGKNGRNGKK